MAIPIEVKETILGLRNELKYDPLLFAHLADLLISIRKIGDAEKLLKTGTQRYPNYPTGWMVLGNLLFAQSHYELAFKAFARAVELEPGNPYALNQCATIALKLRNRVEHIKYLHLSVECDPLNDDTRTVLETAMLKKAALDLGTFNEEQLDMMMPDAILELLIKKEALPEELWHLNKSAKRKARIPEPPNPIDENDVLPGYELVTEQEDINPNPVSDEQVANVPEEAVEESEPNMDTEVVVADPIVTEIPADSATEEPGIEPVAEDGPAIEEFKRMYGEVSDSKEMVQEMEDFLPPREEIEAEDTITEPKPTEPITPTFNVVAQDVEPSSPGFGWVSHLPTERDADVELTATMGGKILHEEEEQSLPEPTPEEVSSLSDEGVPPEPVVELVAEGELITPEPEVAPSLVNPATADELVSEAATALTIDDLDFGPAEGDSTTSVYQAEPSEEARRLAEELTAKIRSSQEADQPIAELPEESDEIDDDLFDSAVKIPKKAFAELFADQGEYQKALLIYQELLKLHPENKAFQDRIDELKIIIADS